MISIMADQMVLFAMLSRLNSLEYMVEKLFYNTLRSFASNLIISYTCIHFQI